MLAAPAIFEGTHCAQQAQEQDRDERGVVYLVAWWHQLLAGWHGAMVGTES